MKTAINLLFWGYLLVVLNIQIGIDLLPDPLGYLLIASGCSRLQDQHPIAQKARLFSTLMIFISFPTVFINLSEATSFGWSSYSMAIMFLQLIVVYFLFAILQDIVREYGEDRLLNRTNSSYTIYISLNLLLLAALSFSMNIPEVVGGTIILILIVATLIMEIVLLVLLRAIRRAVPSRFALDIKENKPMFIEEDYS